MGFLGSMFGWSQSMAAVNAVLASELITKTSPVQQTEIATEVGRILQGVRRNQGVETLISELSREDRVVQGNFIALACDNLGIQPSIPNNAWTRVKNPYADAAQVTDAHIEAAVDAIAKQDGIKVRWPGRASRIDLLELLCQFR